MHDISKTIGWAHLSWLPFWGCRNNCRYCYARRLNDRFHFIPNFNEPQFFPERLNEPLKKKQPKIIFVGDMGEIFDLPRDQVQQIIDITKQAPQHRYMFLTQKPGFYLEYEFPVNCWLGITITDKELLNRRKNLIDKITAGLNRTFLSIEPIQSDFAGVDLSAYDEVIVGSETGLRGLVPNFDWVNSVQHSLVFYKHSAIEWMKNPGWSTTKKICADIDGYYILIEDENKKCCFCVLYNYKVIVVDCKENLKEAKKAAINIYHEHFRNSIFNSKG